MYSVGRKLHAGTLDCIGQKPNLYMEIALGRLLVNDSQPHHYSGIWAIYFKLGMYFKIGVLFYPHNEYTGICQ